MNHQKENVPSHRQEREQEKEHRSHSTSGRFLSSIHPAWYVLVAVIACGAAVLIWTFIPW